MKRNGFYVMLLAFGLVLIGCGDGAGGDSGNPAGLRAKLNNNQYPGRVIDVYPGATDITSGEFIYGANGFSVTVDGIPQAIEKLDLDTDKNKIYLVESVPNTGTIELSYDGTCSAAYKLPKFTNLTVSR
jgi:hypothetical protein